MTDDEQLDEELGTPDPEATGRSALDTLPDEAPAPQAPDQEVPGGVATPAVTAPQVTPPAIPAAIPAAPPGMHVVKGTRTQPAAGLPEMAAGQAAEQKVFGDQKKLAGDEAALQGKAAEIEQQRAEQIADETARQNAQIQAEQLYQQEQAKARADQYSRDIDELKRQKPPGGFAEWSGGRRALAGISMAIGGLQAGRNGTANFAIQDVDRMVDKENERYNAGIQQQMAILEKRHGLNTELDNQAKDLLAQGQARKVLALDSMNKYADAQLKALGIPAAQQAGIKAQLGIDQKAAEAQQKYGQILASKVTDTMQVAPGKAGAGGGGTGGVVDLVKMAENGAKRSEIVAAAQHAGIPEKAWKNQVDLAFVEREKGEAAKEKGAAAKEADDDKRAVRDPQGNVIGYAGGARPNVKQIQDQLINFSSAEDFLNTMLKNHDHVPMGSDWHNGVLAIASTTTANPSDATTKHEAGTLTGAMGLIDRDAVKTKLADIQKRKAAFMKGLRPVDKEGSPAEEKPAGNVAPEGTVIVGAGGKTLVKQGGKWVAAR